MGYIKKLKSNELVGGTDKQTIYPVTSTKAVFEEVTEGDKSSFKSQETINGEHDDRIKGLEEEMPDTVKSITINGGTEHTVDESGNVDLTIYTVNPDDPDVPAMADLVEKNRDDIADIKEEIGTDTTQNTLSGRITELETLVGGNDEGSVNQRITNAVNALDVPVATVTDTTGHVSVALGETDGKINSLAVSTEDIASAEALNTLDIYVHAIEGGNIRVKTSVPTNPDTGAPANTVYRVAGTTTYSDYMWNGTTMVKMAEYNVDTLESQFGYYKWETASNTISITTNNQVAGSPIGSYVLTSGGSFKIKMTNKATGACTLNMNGKGAKTLLYNGDPVASNNTWENDEVISVYYDGSVYQASNAQGGAKMDDTPQIYSEKAVKSNGIYKTTPTNTDGGGADLSITDEIGNAIVQFEDGQVKTKNFDSATISNIEEGDDGILDFSVKDSQGNDIVQFFNGGIKTKNFDSTFRNYPELFSQYNPFGISATRYFTRAGKKAYYPKYAPLIIVAGQSNADGRIIYTSAPSWLADNNYAIDNFEVWDTSTGTFQTYNVKGMTGNGGAVPGADGMGENKYAFDAQFAHDWLAQYGGKLYMVRQTLGAIGIETQPTTGTRNWTWQPDIDNIVSGCHSMCLALMNKVLQAFDYAYHQGIILIPLCILWHQGEGDSAEGMVEKYKDNLSNLIMWMRGLFLTPTLPFICGEVNKNYSQGYAQINSIFSEIENEDEYMQVVSMEGHYTTLDNIHFDADAIAYMGSQMFNEIQKYI